MKRWLSKNYRKKSDESLMELLKKGDKSSFEELYKRYSKRLLFYFYKMLWQDEPKSQDFLQEIFIKIIEKPEAFQQGKKFSTWIFSVAHNMCKNEYRRKINRNEIALETDHEKLWYDSEWQFDFEQNLFKKQFNMALEKLNDNQKAVFIFRYKENLSILEIAEILECSEGTVKSRLYYASRKLAELLKNFSPVN